MRLRLATALVCCLAAAVPGAALGSPSQESTFQDDKLLVYGEPADVAKTMDRLRGLGVDRLRISVFWQLVAPDAKKQAKPAFDATDPAAYPAGAWDRYDTIVRLAAARGLAVNFNVTSPAPFWATGSLPDRPDLDKDYDPNPIEFGAFVQAVGKRYSGSYVPPPVATPAPAPASPGIGLPRQSVDAGALPRVSYWTVWNEPNQPGWLTPQWTEDPRSGGGLVEAAPRIYRSLADAMWAGLGATGHQADTILVGETAPKGQARVKGPTRAIKPGRFLRQLYCLDDNLQFLRGSTAELRGCPVTDQAARMAADHPALFKASGYAHHPYELTFAPTRKPTDADDFTTANLDALSGLLRRIYQRYGQKPSGGGRNVPLYLTEYGYQTDPPDPGKASFAAQAAYLNEAEWLTFRNPLVRTLTQFLLRDDGPEDGVDPAKDPVQAYGVTFQSGLQTLAGTDKPALAAYRFPIHLPTRVLPRGRKLRVFGLVRTAANGGPSPRVQVQLRTAKGRFRTVRTVAASRARGYLQTTLTVRRGGIVRLLWQTGTTTLTSREVSFRVKR